MNDYSTKKFALIQRHDCTTCGFFSFYIVHLGCIYKYLSEGYIPIVDLQDYKNIYNNFNISSFYHLSLPCVGALTLKHGYMNIEILSLKRSKY